MFWSLSGMKQSKWSSLKYSTSSWVFFSDELIQVQWPSFLIRAQKTLWHNRPPKMPKWKIQNVFTLRNGGYFLIISVQSPPSELRLKQYEMLLNYRFLVFFLVFRYIYKNKIFFLVNLSRTSPLNINTAKDLLNLGNGYIHLFA